MAVLGTLAEVIGIDSCRVVKERSSKMSCALREEMHKDHFVIWVMPIENQSFAHIFELL